MLVAQKPKVQVGPDILNITHRFLVSSQVLIGQSQVFSNFVNRKATYRPLKRVLNNIHPETIILDEDGEAMVFVLKALHHRYGDLRNSSFDNLVKVAAIIEKYGLHMPLYHVAKAIYEPWLAEKPEMTGNWVMLSRTFRLEKQFREVTENLIKCALRTLGEGGVLQTDTAKNLSSAIPEAVVCESRPYHYNNPYVKLPY